MGAVLGPPVVVRGVAAGRSTRFPTAPGRRGFPRTTRQRAIRAAEALYVATQGTSREDQTTCSPLHPA